MEDFVSIPRIGVTILALAVLSGCQSMAMPKISPIETEQLQIYVAAYHYCVARTATRIDDGWSPIADIAAKALDHCQPEARDVSSFLGSMQVPDAVKTHYIEELLAIAARKSALMLRRQRVPDWNQRQT